MSAENGITVYCDGKSEHLELSKREAEKFLRFAGAACDAPEWAPPTKEQINERFQRSGATETNAVAFKEQIQRIAQLEPDQLALVFALIEVMEFEDTWISECVYSLLREVQCSGVDKASERDPRMVLADLAFDLFDFWDDIDTAKQRAASHPALFAPALSPEPPAAPQPTQRIRRRSTKPPRARKAVSRGR